jgi:hypothetical protein
MYKIEDKGITFWVDEHNRIYDVNKRVLKQRKKKTGLTYVQYYRHGIKTTHCVHVLVAKAYVPNPLNLPYVKHIDGNSWDNFRWNLAWTDKREYKVRRVKKLTKRQYFQTFTSQKQMKEYFINIGLDVEVCADGDVLVFRDGKLCQHFLILHTSKNCFNVQVLNIPLNVVRIEMEYPALHFFDGEGNEYID